MAAIGAGWVDGAWVEAGWVTGAWQAAGATAPTVEAGGPYEASRAHEVTLDATITPGTDPAPTNLWTIVSGGTGSFNDATLADPIFIPDATGTYTLRLTVTSSDAGVVTDDATVQVIQRGSTLVSRRLQMIRRDDEEVLALIRGLLK